MQDRMLHTWTCNWAKDQVCIHSQNWETLPAPTFQTEPIRVPKGVEKTSDVSYCTDRAITMYCVWSDFNSSDCFLTAKTSLKIAADGEDGFFFDRKASYVKSDPMPNLLSVMYNFS